MKCSVLLCFCSFWGGPLSADIIAQYAFDASSPASSDASTHWDTSDVSNGPGVPLTLSGAQGNPAPGIQITFGDFDNGDLNGALLAGDYYAFDITPDPGARLTLTTFTFDIWKTASAGATVSATLFSSVAGFASAGDAIGNGQLVGTGQAGAFFNRSIDVSGLLEITGLTSFRLYLDDGNATNNANNLRLDNLVLNGTVQVVPEPSSLILAGLGFCALFLRRRR